MSRVVTSGFAVVLITICGSISSVRAQDSASRSQNYLEERKSLNQRYNEKAKAAAVDYRQALSDHLQKGEAYPTGFTQRFRALDQERAKDLQALEKRIANQAAREEDPRTLAAGENGKTSTSRTRRNPPAAPKFEVSAPSTGTVLDGSNVPREIEFPGPGAKPAGSE